MTIPKAQLQTFSLDKTSNANQISDVLEKLREVSIFDQKVIWIRTKGSKVDIKVDHKSNYRNHLKGYSNNETVVKKALTTHVKTYIENHPKEISERLNELPTAEGHKTKIDYGTIKKGIEHIQGNKTLDLDNTLQQLGTITSPFRDTSEEKKRMQERSAASTKIMEELEKKPQKPASPPPSSSSSTPASGETYTLDPSMLDPDAQANYFSRFSEEQASSEKAAPENKVESETKRPGKLVRKDHTHSRAESSKIPPPQTQPKAPSPDSPQKRSYADHARKEHVHGKRIPKENSSVNQPAPLSRETTLQGITDFPPQPDSPRQK